MLIFINTRPMDRVHTKQLNNYVLICPRLAPNITMISFAAGIYYTNPVSPRRNNWVNNHFERSRMKNNEIYFMGPKITSRDRE
jgi:hypothetical protein